jgi:hypothetical protein
MIISWALDAPVTILRMAGCVGDDELAFWRREVFISHINGNALLPFGTKAVGQQCQIDRPVFLIPALFLQGLKLIGQDIFAVIQQAANERTLSVIHTARGNKSQEVHALYFSI